MPSARGAHYWARQLAQLGHHVRLMPPQFVRPYVKTNKNDAADAEACCEAVQRPGMRFVPVKSVDQQTAMALHRVRDHLVRQRTGTINALRGHLAEFGIVAAAQRTGLNQLVAIVEDDGASDELPFAMRAILQMLIEEIRAADERIEQLDRKLNVNDHRNGTRDLHRIGTPCVADDGSARPGGRGCAAGASAGR